MKTHAQTAILAAAVALSCTAAAAEKQPVIPAAHECAPNRTVFADTRGYGEKKEVANPEQAQKLLKEYIAAKGKDLEIGEITEKELYFEAEIRMRGGSTVDKVIIDKRTGRIRSIY